LKPFSLNFSPNGLSLPPPAGFAWHCPHGKPVWAANSGFALVGVEATRPAVILTNSAVAMAAAVQAAALRIELEALRRPEGIMGNPFSVFLENVSVRLDKKCSAASPSHKYK
jgi:hypothetical protein